MNPGPLTFMHWMLLSELIPHSQTFRSLCAHALLIWFQKNYSSPRIHLHLAKTQMLLFTFYNKDKIYHRCRCNPFLNDIKVIDKCDVCRYPGLWSHGSFQGGTAVSGPMSLFRDTLVSGPRSLLGRCTPLSGPRFLPGEGIPLGMMGVPSWTGQGYHPPIKIQADSACRGQYASCGYAGGLSCY